MTAEGPKSVLIVDDDDDTGDLLGVFFERAGWGISLATDVEHARMALAAGKFSALVTDVNLPDGSGLSLLDGGRSPILRAAVVMTGSSDPHERHASEQAGFDGYYTKPVDGAELVSIITRLMSGDLGPR